MSNAPAAETVRLLLVEDSPLDAELVLDELRDDGLALDFRVVEAEPDLVAALQDFRPQIVLSDLSLPAFSGHRALDLVLELAPTTPFIFVSGTIGEDTAVEAIKRGASDYVLKGNLTRLSSAVRAALRAAAERAARERAEQELVRAQRFESLALLASGLSHDLRNILQPALMAARMIEDEAPSDHMRKLGRLVHDCAERGLDMVASMLDFARGRRMHDERIDVATLFEALGLLLKGSLPRNVELKLDPGTEPLALAANPTELQQCLLNLSLNAIQAMPDGGKLELSAQRRELGDDFFAAGEDVRGGNYIHIAVSDTGVGMPPEVVGKLFTPFFTTKGDGTGLGLVSCSRIVKNYKGIIRVDSRPAAGTRFDIYLPVGAERGAAAVDIQGRGERVLLVDEEASSLALLRDALEAHGYMVAAAQGGAAALQEIRRSGLPDVAIVDADMNLMTGVRTLLALQEREYAGPVLLLSRDRRELEGDALPPLPRLRVLVKPVAIDALLKELRVSLEP